MMRIRPKWLEHNPRHLPLVFFDLETTGGNPQNSGITEVGLIKWQGNREVGRYHTLVNPERPISSYVHKITGIHDDMVKNAPKIQEVIGPILDFIGDGILVSHGVLADYAYIHHSAQKYQQIEIRNFYLCTHLLVANALAHVPSKSLSGVADYFGIDFKDAHRAIADAEITAKIFWKIVDVLEKNGLHSIEDLLKIQGDVQSLKKLGSGLNLGDVEKTPTSPGIYYLFNQRHEVIFASATENIKRSLRNFTRLSDDREHNELVVDASGFKFERQRHFFEALLTEKNELKRLSLRTDPRKLERRSHHLFQVLLPSDLLAWGQQHPEELPFQIPGIHIVDSAEFERTDLDDLVDPAFSQEFGSQHAYIRGSILPLAERPKPVPIKRFWRRSSLVKNRKSIVSAERHPRGNGVLQFGQLKPALGWVFGPVESTKQLRSQLEDLLALLPFHDAQLPPIERYWLLQVFISKLYGTLPEQLRLLQIKNNGRFSLFNFYKQRQLLAGIEFLEHIRQFPLTLKRSELPSTGLAVLSDNDHKQLDVYVIVKGYCRKHITLPREEAAKLRSSRFFTRLLLPYRDELFFKENPLSFSAAVCHEVELVAHWRHRHQSEGEWVDFSELEALYDETVL